MVPPNIYMCSELSISSLKKIIPFQTWKEDDEKMVDADDDNIQKQRGKGLRRAEEVVAGRHGEGRGGGDDQVNAGD